MKKHLYTRAVISNKFIEVYQQDSPPIQHRTSNGGRKLLSQATIKQNDDNIKAGINRARREIRRLIECNFNEEYSFVTLTFKPSSTINVTDYTQCYKAFTDFKKRLSYHLKKNNLAPFKYLGVTEFQEKIRRGAIHYHLVCNLTFISKETLELLWRHGSVDLSIVTGSYTDNEKISYYLRKGITDPRLNGRKKYFRSQGLQKPIKLEVENLEVFFECLQQNGNISLCSETYHSSFSGEVYYQTYYVNNTEELIKNV